MSLLENGEVPLDDFAFAVSERLNARECHLEGVFIVFREFVWFEGRVFLGWDLDRGEKLVHLTFK